jgi:phytoene/squalene synthetase
VEASISSDREYCERALVAVSRSFSKPIELLPEPLRVALTCGYLLCRVVDTVEDYPPLESGERDELFSLFIAVLDGRQPAAAFSARFLAISEQDPEIALAQALPRVMRVFASQEQATREATTRWLAEMANGMRLYCRRDSKSALTAINTASDLERYCYFVAGTVGHLITDLFCGWLGNRSGALEHELRARCESFGIGLQLVNILKDVTDDFERNRCYVPRQFCRAEGFEPELLLSLSHRPQAHRALARVFERAAEHLDDAFEYTLLIPAKDIQLRLFCLLPLWMALETLLVAVGNDAVLSPNRPVKIARDTVEGIAEYCLRHANDDANLRRRYASLAARLTERIATLGLVARSHAAAPEGHAQL